MPKDEWGVKRVCPACATRFYDLRRDPMTCPSCGHSATIESLTASKSRVLAAPRPTPKDKERDVIADDDEAVIDDDDTDVDLGDDVLDDEDSDDVSLDDLADVASDDDEN